MIWTAVGRRCYLPSAEDRCPKSALLGQLTALHDIRLSPNSLTWAWLVRAPGFSGLRLASGRGGQRREKKFRPTAAIGATMPRGCRRPPCSQRTGPGQASSCDDSIFAANPSSGQLSVPLPTLISCLPGETSVHAHAKFGLFSKICGFLLAQVERQVRETKRFPFRGRCESRRLF
jgi:hypothetical protein